MSTKAIIKLGPTRLSESELLEAIDRYLKQEGRIPQAKVGVMRYAFKKSKEDGRLYFEWSYEEVPNVIMLPRRR